MLRNKLNSLYYQRNLLKSFSIKPLAPWFRPDYFTDTHQSFSKRPVTKCLTILVYLVSKFRIHLIEGWSSSVLYDYFSAAQLSAIFITKSIIVGRICHPKLMRLTPFIIVLTLWALSDDVFWRLYGVKKPRCWFRHVFI